MTVTGHVVSAADGRTLEVREAGTPERPVLLSQHGTPGSAGLYRSEVEGAERLGLRLLAYSRPGYGGSSPHPGRSVADAAADVAAILDALGVERFATYGWSGGGPHALACAVLLPERFRAAALVAGVAPYGVDGLDWVAGMGQDNVEEFGAAMQGEQPLRDFLEQARDGILAATPGTLADKLASVLPPVDVAALSAGFADHVHRSMSEGLAPGTDGWLDDDLAFVTGWELDLAALRVPVLVVAGGQDLMVPPAHGRWLAQHVPGAQAWVRDDEGHLSLLADIGRVHAWLLEHWAD